MPVTFSPPPAKLAPDARDRRIFQMIRDGQSVREIAAELDVAYQSVVGRMDRMKAQRWATHCGRLLDAEERDELLAFEPQLLRDR